MLRLTTSVRSIVALCVITCAASTDAAPITEAQAQHCFNVMRAQQDIAFGFVADGCYARAHLMARRLQQMGYRPNKAWAFAKDQRRPLRFGNTTWTYHVAPCLQVRTNSGAIRIWVIDPSMFGRAVDVDVWFNAMHPQNASGSYSDSERYFPDGRVPRLGSDQHAAYVMWVYRYRLSIGDRRALSGNDLDPAYLPRTSAVEPRRPSVLFAVPLVEEPSITLAA
jgi:hypothetical protein